MVAKSRTEWGRVTDGQKSTRAILLSVLKMFTCNNTFVYSFSVVQFFTQTPVMSCITHVNICLPFLVYSSLEGKCVFYKQM